MKQKLIMQLVVIFICQLISQIAYSETNTIPQAILQDGEITGIKIERTNMRPWCTGIDAKKMPVETKGVEQYVAIHGSKTLILYAEFASTSEAHQAAEFYSKNMACIFYPGLWNGAQNKSIGEESWYGNNPTGNAILFRSGRTCVLVSCHSEDVVKRKQVAELLAKQIEQKIQKGGRVIMPGNRQKNGTSQNSTNELTGTVQ